MIEDIRIKKGSKYLRQVVYQQDIDGDGNKWQYFGPIQNIPMHFDEWVEFTYDGKTPLNVYAYELYRSILGESAARQLWWVIVWFTDIQSVFDLEVNSKLRAPTIKDVQRLIL